MDDMGQICEYVEQIGRNREVPRVFCDRGSGIVLSHVSATVEMKAGLGPPFSLVSAPQGTENTEVRSSLCSALCLCAPGVILRHSNVATTGAVVARSDLANDGHDTARSASDSLAST